MPHCPIRVSFRKQRTSKSIICHGVLGPDNNSGLKLLDRFIERTAGLQHFAEVVMRFEAAGRLLHFVSCPSLL